MIAGLRGGEQGADCGVGVAGCGPPSCSTITEAGLAEILETNAGYWLVFAAAAIVWPGELLSLPACRPGARKLPR
jgi:hypothetical protein